MYFFKKNFVFLPCSPNVPQEVCPFLSPYLSSLSEEDKSVGTQLNFDVCVLHSLNHHPGVDNMSNEYYISYLISEMHKS